MTREKKASILEQACTFWFMLDDKTRDDLIDGKCIYSQYDCVPIIDYTRKHPIFHNVEQE